MKNQGLFLAATTLLLLASPFACSSDPKAKANSVEPPVAQVVVAVVEPRADAGFIEAIGRVKNLRESTIAAKVMGKVSKVFVKAGQVVKKGDLLIRIDDQDPLGRLMQAQGALAQAEASAAVAKQMLDRYVALKAKDSTSQAVYDKAMADYRQASGSEKQAQGALATARSYLAETTIKAPFAGTVIDTMIEEGEMASPGFPLLRMEGGAGELEFEATVNAQDVALVSAGQGVTILVDTNGGRQTELPGTVTEIVPSQDRVTHTSIVRIGLQAADGLRSGMFGRASFARTARSCPGIVIDSDRIVRHGQLEAVFVVDATDRLRLRLVREGKAAGGKSEILSGLDRGDRLVVSAIDTLLDGQPAKVVK